MKHIINGKKYDTETAAEMASWHNGLAMSDFNWCQQSLYCKRTTGEYFVAGEGGPNTFYARQVGDGRTGGEGIQPMNEAEALRWCETHDIDADTIEAIFGPIPE